MTEPTQRQADGLPLLLGYQTRWMAETARFAVCEKGRRIGLSWADAAERVVYAAEGKGHILYMSYNKDMTETYISDCAAWARRFNLAIPAVIEETIITKDKEQIHRYRIECDSGKRILALSSNPRVLRSKGKPGDIVVIDEAAFCDDLPALLKAATAVAQWGGRVRIISTHNGEANAFNRLVSDIRAGRHPQYALHRITLDDAIAAGLARRVYSVTGRDWYAGAEQDWRQEIVSGYTDRDAADEELFCVPRQGGGAWLRWQWLHRAVHQQAGLPAHYAGGITYIGVDVARRNDLWVAVVLERVGDVLWLRQLCAERGITFRQQGDIIRRLTDTYRPIRIAVDQTGMGEAVVEQLQDAHGRVRVDGVLLSAPRRLAVATALRERFEDGTIRISGDRLLADDLHAIKAEQGVTGSPRLVAARTGIDGHADRFWALALACAAAAEASGPMEYHASGVLHPSATLDSAAYLGALTDYRGYG